MIDPNGDLVEKPPYTPATETVPSVAARQNRLPQRDRAVGLEHQRLLGAVVCVMHRAVRFHAHRIDAGVRTAAAGDLRERLENVGLLVVDGLRAARFPRHAQALGETIDRHHTLRAQQERALDGELSHGPASPDRDGVSRLDVAGFGGHVAGGKMSERNSTCSSVKPFRF